MKDLIDLPNEEAKLHFLKGSSYFHDDLPKYISFEPILNDVSSVLSGNDFSGFKSSKNPKDFPKVNYRFLTNKDGKFAWRPLELIHPVLYVSLVNTICENENWKLLKRRFKEFRKSAIDCCSDPVISLDDQSDKAKQIMSWWHKVEQKALSYSLGFSHILHTDVTDCYGSFYTHCIPQAIHGIPQAKKNKDDKSLLGNKIDITIRAGRYGQTNGISQGSVLMDFIAEIVLGFIDEQINIDLPKSFDFRILRYRDDYWIFADSDEQVEMVLKIISEKLLMVGMKLGMSKTTYSKNVIAGSIKSDKLAGIDLQDLGNANAKTIQKQLLRLHSFGQQFPNSGALRRLVNEFDEEIRKQPEKPDDLEVQIAIATDIGFVSPSTFPGIASILSYLISLAPANEKPILWEKVCKKMARVPNNGYLEIWLQRVVKPIGLHFESKEPICKIVDNKNQNLWENGWIDCKELIKALRSSKIYDGSASQMNEVVQPEEIELFRQNAWTS